MVNMVIFTEIEGFRVDFRQQSMVFEALISWISDGVAD